MTIFILDLINFFHIKCFKFLKNRTNSIVYYLLKKPFRLIICHFDYAFLLIYIHQLEVHNINPLNCKQSITRIILPQKFQILTKDRFHISNSSKCIVSVKKEKIHLFILLIGLNEIILKMVILIRTRTPNTIFDCFVNILYIFAPN